MKGIRFGLKLLLGYIQMEVLEKEEEEVGSFAVEKG